MFRAFPDPRLRRTERRSRSRGLASLLATSLFMACSVDSVVTPHVRPEAPVIRQADIRTTALQCITTPFTLTLVWQGTAFAHTFVLTSSNGRDLVGTATFDRDSTLFETITGLWDGTTLTLTSIYFINGTPNGYSYTIAGMLDQTGYFTGGGFSSNGQVFDPGSVTGAVCVTPPNDAPVVTQLAMPTSPAAFGTGISVTADFTDPNPGDTHTAVFAWGDGQTSAAIPTTDGGAGSVTASHVYQAAGVYTVNVTVTDNGGLSGSLSSATNTAMSYIVLYDPTGGFVTGGGWIVSPAGAYTLAPAASGRASFGFVSKYQHGATVPSGATEFDFTMERLNFKSTSYQWLVVAGARAQFKGAGTINGTGSYGFLLTAIDGALNGGGADRFRIKIVDETSGTVIYDNQLGASDDGVSATALSGGSIVIHN